MRGLVWMFVLCSVRLPAQDVIAHGAEVYNKSCATGYCHGLKGAAGGAPRLAARNFDEAYITQTVRSGIAGTAMPAFGEVLSRLDLYAVTSYVATLNGITPARNPYLERGPAPKALSAEAAKGKSLFFDATKGFGRCSTCHQVDGLGIAVADTVAKAPESVAALKALPATHVQTAEWRGSSFPALVVRKGALETKLFDLTLGPPVLRTLPSADVKISSGSGNWRHADAMKAYQDEELTNILDYLRTSVHP